MTPERLAEIRQFVMRFGPANCWTGTLGTACEYIFELIGKTAEGGDWPYRYDGPYRPMDMLDFSDCRPAHESPEMPDLRAFYRSEGEIIFEAVRAILDGKSSLPDKAAFAENFAAYFADRDLSYSQQLEQKFASLNVAPPPRR